MEESGKKTIICSVLFLDVVEYSKKSVSGQIVLKEGFNAFLSIAIRDVPIDDRIILDTGDGAVISFLGDVEDALKAALIMRASLLSAGTCMDPPLLVRMGINLGPVRMVKDINGLPNIVGDGINVAQRIMGFSDPGQILVSRSYYEAVSRLSQEYAGMFHYEGSRTDKHVREHEVYAIGYPGEFTATQHRMALGGHRQTKNKFAFGLSVANYYSRIAWLRVEAWTRLALATYRNATAQQRALYLLAMTVPLTLLLALAVKIIQLSIQHAPLAPIVKTQEGWVVQPDAVDKVAGEAAAAAKSLSAQQEKIRKRSARTRTLEETTAINSGAPARVNLTVTPWGEIYLNGRMQGVSPPLTELEVVPGTHLIEIRNTTFPIYSQIFHVDAKGVIKIKHKFSN